MKNLSTANWYHDYQRLLVSKVSQLLQTNSGSSLFFVFNVEYLTGDDSVIDLMRLEGFEVERVRLTDDLNNWEATGHTGRLGPDRVTGPPGQAVSPVQQGEVSGGAQRRGLSLVVVAVLTFLSLQI